MPEADWSKLGLWEAPTGYSTSGPPMWCGILVTTGPTNCSAVEQMTRGSRCRAHHIRALFADHDRGRVGVAGHDGRHDRGVGDAKCCDAMDPELGIDDRIGLPAHAARAYRMQVRDAARADVGPEIGVAGDRGPRQELLDDEWLQRRLPRDLSADLHAADDR